jgi:hypothetical protein
MRATKAYIASLGTTGVLLGAALLMLAVVSAVVAFDRWPAGTVSTRVQTLVLNDSPAPIRVSATAILPTGRAPGAGALSGPAGLHGVAGVRLSGGNAGTPAGVVSAPVHVPGAPQLPLPATPPLALDNPNPSNVRSALADRSQAATDTAGRAVAGAHPAAGQAVTGAGQTAAGGMRQLPLPGSVLP